MSVKGVPSRQVRDDRRQNDREDGDEAHLPGRVAERLHHLPLDSLSATGVCRLATVVDQRWTRPRPWQVRSFLNEALAGVEGGAADDAGWDEVAAQAIQQRRATGQFVPGLGHHLHKDGDPRVPRLLELAHEHGTYGDVLGKPLPLNAAGACGAVLADLGIPQELLRGVVLLARCAGLLGSSLKR